MVRRIAAALAFVGAATMLTAAATPDAASRGNYRPQRTSWGEPDLSGSWPIDHLNGTPMQRDPALGDRAVLSDAEFAERTKRVEGLAARYANEGAGDKLGQGHWVEMGQPSRRSSLLVSPLDGRFPAMTEEGKLRAALMRSSWRQGQSFDWTSDFDSWDRCITRGLPASMFPVMYNNGIRIFQSPGLVAIQLEMVHDVRLVPTDGRGWRAQPIQGWMGESRGRWEDGNTLVVETRHLDSSTSATAVTSTPISDQATMVERFTMTGRDTIAYRITYTDPVVFTAPWTAELDWQRNDGYRQFEYACHEGNVQIRNYITSSRTQRATAGGQ